MGWSTRRPNLGDEGTKTEEGERQSVILTGGRLGHEPPVAPGRTINQAALPSPT